MIQNGILGRPLRLHLCMIPYYNILWLAWHQAIHARKAHSVRVQAKLCFLAFSGGDLFYKEPYCESDA